MNVIYPAPDEKRGESPCALVELAPGAEATANELLAHCRERLAEFKRPNGRVIGELPQTPTGNVRKHELRDSARGVA